MPPGFGHDHYVQIGRESVWGTEVNATRKINVISTDLQAVRGKVRSDVLIDKRNRQAILSGPQMARMTMELQADYEGQLHIWDAAFGTDTYAADGGTSAGSYVWTFRQRDLFNSYTIEAVTNIPSGKCDLALGMKLNRLRFSGTPGLDAAPCRLSTEWFGKSVTVNTTPTSSLTANSPLAIMPGHVDTANLDVGTADTAGTDRLRSWEILIDNKLVERFYGADTIDEPLADDYAETSVRWSIEFTSEKAITEYLANTAGNPTLKLMTSASRYLQFDMDAGYIVAPVGRPIDRWGILTQEFTFEAVDDGATPSSGIILAVGTTEATIS